MKLVKNMNEDNLSKIIEIILDYTLDLPCITKIDEDKIEETAAKIYLIFLDKNY